MVARGFKSGGRKPLSPAGAAVVKAVRFPPDLAEDLETMATETGTPVADIVRAGADSEVKKWRRKTGRPPR